MAITAFNPYYTSDQRPTAQVRKEKKAWQAAE
jgi:hypothetical protein